MLVAPVMAEKTELEALTIFGFVNWAVTLALFLETARRIVGVGNEGIWLKLRGLRG